MSSTDLWSYPSTMGTSTADLTGYKVEATDGSIGKIDEKSDEASASYVVVDTGPWIFGKKRLIPAGAITRVDHDEQRVHLQMTKDQIKSAPDYDKDTWDDDARTSHGDYYGGFGRQ